MLRCDNDHANAVVFVGQVKDFGDFVDNALCKGVSTVRSDVSKLLSPLKKTLTALHGRKRLSELLRRE